MTDAARPYPSDANRRLYVEVENGQRIVLPPGMTECDLLKSVLRRLLRERPRLLPDPRDGG